MRAVLSREQSRDFDRQAIETLGVPGLVLMENAGRGAADVLLQRYPKPGRVLVVCGLGNNGGDGYVVARRLLTLGYEVQVLALTPQKNLPGDARSNAQSYRALGGECSQDDSDALTELRQALPHCNLVVDALFGTGLSRPVTGRLAQAIDLLNTCNRPVVSLDLPSGLDANTGEVHGAVVRAALTTTFLAHKRGLLTATGQRTAGRVEVVDIGVPGPALGQTSVQLTEDADIRRLLLERPLPRHKGEAGRVTVVAGSSGKLGAARLSAHGAHRGGAGLVTIATFEDAAASLDQATFETMTLALPRASAFEVLAQARADVLALGPGLGLDQSAGELIDAVLERWPGCVVVDADALTHCGERLDLLRRAAGPRILTPHPAEAARLLGTDLGSVQADRFGAAQRLSELSLATVLLKGVYTLVAQEPHAIAVNDTGCSALAAGGSGDVLTGLIAALATHLPPRSAAMCGAWVHGAAAELWADRTGACTGMLAREAADLFPAVLGSLTA